MSDAAAAKSLPTRDEVTASDRWDLSPLFTSDADWEPAFEAARQSIEPLGQWRGRLSESPAVLREFLDARMEVERAIDRVGQYALRHADVDTGNSHYQGLRARVYSLITRYEEVTAFVRSEILAIDEDTLRDWIADDQLAPWRVQLERLLRDKPYTLTEREERLLALAGELTRAPVDIFTKLNASDLDFGTLVDSEGQTHEVTHGGYMTFMTHPERQVRHDFFRAYYAEYDAHRNTLASVLTAGLKARHFGARARGFESTRHQALHRNHIPLAVYDNLVTTVRDNLEPLHRYYGLLARVHGLDKLAPWDLLAPAITGVELGRAYDDAVDLLEQALVPLGSRYVSTLCDGLRQGWVDRYENKGKVSGAYSSGCYDSPPYILMNYRSTSLESVYTLAHEAGHSMHSWMAIEHQTPQDADYSIFVAEVASTFNEILLTHHLLATHDDPRDRARIITRELDGLRGLIYRQTMFAEYEQTLYGRIEADEALSVDDIRGLYRELLEHHLGPHVEIDPQLELESLRIPHFYFGYYVYQYATGVSAALALSQRVLDGEEGALDDYLGFLAAGGSGDPIDVLRDAGVDMTRPEPIEAALAHYARRVDELEQLIAELGA